MKYVKALTIAGSDCTGGAGIQADIKTMSALGVYAASVVTAVTAQNCKGVKSVQPVAPEVIYDQIEAVMSEQRPEAIKIGMVNDSDSMRAIAEALHPYDALHLVVDPVMTSSTGQRLMDETAVSTFKECLLPICSLLTPNLFELEMLSGVRCVDRGGISEAVIALRSYCSNILVKGGHIAGEIVRDSLYYNDREISFESRRVATLNDHGTGCTLSAAITSFLAMGYDAVSACAKAKDYVTAALSAGADMEFELSGHCAMNHFFNPHKLIKV